MIVIRVVNPLHYDLIVVGAGHAGCEAAHAAAKMGAKTLLLSSNLDSIGKMSCNPAIGGTAKGQIVREIDALGGLMGQLIDRCGIQFRMLNASKGPAVWAPRAQADRFAYQMAMKEKLENCPGLEIRQGTLEKPLIENDTVKGALTKEGINYSCSSLIISSGTFLRGCIHIGSLQQSGGRAGEAAAMGLSPSLEKLGFSLGRLKTGTPPRVHSASIDFSLTEEQKGEEGISFSFDPCPYPKLEQRSCFICYTQPQTHDIIRDQLHLSPLYNGAIEGVGPRYCPSIEDKIQRFPDRERHQIFLEPEGLQTAEIYLNGLSTSLPFSTQNDILHSIPALKNAHIMRAAYAIEYDYLISGQIDHTLETKKIEGLFFAGQINGTTGYEEAAAQGLMAGINAVSKLQKREAFVLKRSEAYIGVMIDDIVSKGLSEPYRMFTSRAEHRLLLRQDNADLRLREKGYKLGLISQEQYQRLCTKKQNIQEALQTLQTNFITQNSRSQSFYKHLARPEMNYGKLRQQFPNILAEYSPQAEEQISLFCTYEGYIKRQEEAASKLALLDDLAIPKDLDFSSLKTLRKEAREKLAHFTPRNLGQASRIIGVTPADLQILMIVIKKKNLS